MKLNATKVTSFKESGKPLNTEEIKINKRDVKEEAVNTVLTAYENPLKEGELVDVFSCIIESKNKTLASCYIFTENGKKKVDVIGDYKIDIENKLIASGIHVKF